MSFYVIESFSQLETVYMHLREPIPAICEFVDANEMDIIVVPGVVLIHTVIESAMAVVIMTAMY